MIVFRSKDVEFPLVLVNIRIHSSRESMFYAWSISNIKNRISVSLKVLSLYSSGGKSAKDGSEWLLLFGKPPWPTNKIRCFSVEKLWGDPEDTGRLARIGGEV